MNVIVLFFGSSKKEKGIDKIEKLVNEHIKEVYELLETFDKKDKEQVIKIVDERMNRLRENVKELRRSNVSEKEASRVFSELQVITKELRDNLENFEKSKH